MRCRSLVTTMVARGTLLTLVLALMPAGAQSGVSYQPSQRLRTALEACLNDEVSEGAYCIKKCQPNFKLDAQKGKPPVCVATNAAAKLPAKTSPPVWEPPPPPKKVVPGA